MKIIGFPSIDLPEVVIQYIQSFMSGREAAQTSILSKSWHAAWSTRPNLDFSQLDFGRKWSSYTNVGRFLESSKKTMQRYEQPNLQIESFRLSMDFRERENSAIAGELIARALELGATKLSLSGSNFYEHPLFLTTNTWDLRKIKILHLEKLDVDPLFSSPEFPSLKILTLDECYFKKGTIRISGPSLERISFASTYFQSVAFDVPSIRKFAFSVRELKLPSLAFEATTSMEDWVSDISIVFRGSEFKTSWFLELEKFLDELSWSKISLYLKFEWGEKVVYDYVRDNQCLRKPAAVVENLTVRLHGGYINADSNLLEHLFRSVEPKLITQSWEDLQERELRWSRDGLRRPRDRSEWRLERTEFKFLKLFCKALNTSSLEEVNVECFELDAVNVDCFEETIAEWQPIAWKMLFDVPKFFVYFGLKQIIRFRLKWRVL